MQWLKTTFSVGQYTASIQLMCVLDIVETIVKTWLKDVNLGIFGFPQASM
jgi:hypothetical protein